MPISYDPLWLFWIFIEPLLAFNSTFTFNLSYKQPLMEDSVQSARNGVGELPEPPKPGLLSYLRAAGPGVIVGSLAIGSGELILFPAAVVNYGPSILWAALLSCMCRRWWRLKR